MKKTKTVFLAALVVIQTILLVWNTHHLVLAEVRLEMVETNCQLRKSLQRVTERYCAVRTRLGEAYRITLADVLERTNVLRQPGSAALTVLQAYDTIPDPVKLGIGGPAPGEVEKPMGKKP